MALLEAVDLSRLAEAPARRLSGGEAQRASIARALAAGAEVLLFDEPTANVDFHSRAELIELIRDLWRRRGMSILVTTHDAELADELCPEQIRLFDGKLASAGKAAGGGGESPSGNME
jgi:ABC-type multidrug transport system ATPase subunit